MEGGQRQGAQARVDCVTVALTARQGFEDYALRPFKTLDGTVRSSSEAAPGRTSGAAVCFALTPRHPPFAPWPFIGG
jgi:hypothetical protein